MGNVGSIKNMLKRIDVPSEVSGDPKQIVKSKKLILPGVGAFDNAMRILDESGISTSIREACVKGAHILGICLGMQLLATRSEEGNCQGLNLISGSVKKFEGTVDLKVPHMGWNTVEFDQNEEIAAHLEDNRFYFVHSFYFVPDHYMHSIGSTLYGQKFTSVVRSENVIGAQFHPEKSHRYGMRLLLNYSKL